MNWHSSCHGHYFVGSILIQGIENNLTIEELGSEIISKCNNVTFHQAIEDINHLVANLREKNLIVKSN